LCGERKLIAGVGGEMKDAEQAITPGRVIVEKSSQAEIYQNRCLVAQTWL
jgi:hypothetical protein